MYDQIEDDIKISDGSAILCCGGKKCPTLRIEGDMVSITDDFGGVIRISRDQAALIPQAIDTLEDGD